MAGKNDNKTEKPTSRRLQKAREKGQVARSREVPSAVVLLGTLLILFYTGPNLLAALKVQMHDLLRMRVPGEITVPFLSSISQQVIAQLGLAVAGVMLGAAAFSFVANVWQTGLQISWEPLAFHFDKLSPQNGLTRIFSKTGLVEVTKSVLMLLIVSYISYQVVSDHTPLYPRLVLMDVKQLVYWTSTISYQVFLRVGIFLLILAMADYAFQKYRFLEGLKMTKQEVKDEHKDIEGDPLTKGRIRRIQREMARKRMMAEVPNADVVITNPTHYAVALSYKMETMDAPRVVAKGVGFLALKIKELAQESNIPTVENRPLAQTLYKTVEVGSTIPPNLFKAVAEILAYIYKSRNAWRR
jgi:flagellar biosynthetic protein FlhB